MKPAINNLCQIPDQCLPEVVSTGIKHVLENASSLDSIAHRLFDEGEIRGSNMMHRLAEEEAAKVLVLIDFIRCPKSKSKERSATLKSFYDHVAKSIYAQTCDWRPASFKDICDYIEWKTAGFYLDGPNDVDWIFRNDIVAAREWAMYVDYVQDVTVENGAYSWQVPTDDDSHQSAYSSPRSLKVALALARCGATSVRGVRVISDIWRNYTPKKCSSTVELSKLIARTLSELEADGLNSAGSTADKQVVFDGWAFPLWTLDLRDRTADNQLLKELRNRRRAYIRQWIEIESQREPDLVVTRSAVERLSEAFFLWQSDIDEVRDNYFANQEESRSRIEPGALMQQYDQLDSYKRLESMLRELSEAERIDLLALAWFTRQRPYNWPQHHRHAVEMVKGLDFRYQTGLGKDWLMGFELWQSDPETPSTLDSA